MLSTERRRWVSTPGMYMPFEMLLRALFDREILNAQIDPCPRAFIYGLFSNLSESGLPVTNCVGSFLQLFQ